MRKCEDNRAISAARLFFNMSTEQAEEYIRDADTLTIDTLIEITGGLSDADNNSN